MAQSKQLTPPELAVTVCGMLRSAGIEHAVGGALALGLLAEPRGTSSTSTSSKRNQL